MRIWVEAEQVVKYRFFMEADSTHDADEILEKRIVHYDGVTECGEVEVIGLGEPRYLGCWETFGV